MTISKIPIWLDCDPGHDDAIALLLACFHPRFQLLGVSTCYGNSSPKHTSYNARSLLTAMGQILEVPIYDGAQTPWLREGFKYAPDIHGESGLDGTDLLPTPLVGPRTDMSYLDAMELAIREYPNDVTLVSTGALTSVATLFRDRPSLKGAVKYISIMGGAFSGVGNKNFNNSAEFNVWLDPHAADFLLRDPLVKDKCILTPLNLTHKAIMTEQINKLVRGTHHNNLRLLYYQLFEFFKKTYKDVQGFQDGPPLHDPMTLFPLLQFYNADDAEAIGFKFKRLDIGVVTDLEDLDAGKTFVLKEHAVDGEQGTIVGTDINLKVFWEQILHCLDKAERFSTIEEVEESKPLT
ncbi:trifunctional uridine nucleosidase/nicotinamide riboside hydrolase/nicotinic acid riboside hydrolase KNAG_0C04540 [Huiozyma naganishii CBS 8797]|uniref:Inosine/uridine-preferring nucleoside hydrolase domain-containing protein n=1 Tax=Huiozyma naganishii (strain ATCC MYA-139 / BCRC 22969 / CBS 8797 / KCTC 17520 / NBRC 10181 / NCYC 3082 / Yp74L-3) TaxID=1071383 RepID=J7S663_HUIN7|nr:hypothetical protein KNAG_0C04540 [Kazachstania naganishii CBS 8797]CCK69556.1 hypothetical protein KNAG_0C04540 [Kazachstania naganishii CBS 8797]